MQESSKKSSNFSKVVVGTVLCSVSAAAVYACIREIVGAAKTYSTNHPDQNAKKPNAGVNIGKTEAIAAPENLPIHNLEKLASSQKLTDSQKKAIAKPAPAKTPGTLKSVQVPGSGSSYDVAASRRYWESLRTSPEDITSSKPTSSTRYNFAADDVPAISLTVSLSDIQDHWAQYYIEYLASRYIVHGFPDGTFRPNRPITAAEFATMAQRASQDAVVPQGATFSPPSYRDLQALKPGQSITRAEAAAYIYRKLVRNESPQIVTSVQVTGGVNRPGRYSLAAASDERLGRGNNLPTLSRVIQQAGGATSTADLRQVEIHRKSETGSQKVIKVDVERILQAGNLAHDVVVQQDDRIVIPTASARVPQPGGDFSASRLGQQRSSMAEYKEPGVRSQNSGETDFGLSSQVIGRQPAPIKPKPPSNPSSQSSVSSPSTMGAPLDKGSFSREQSLNSVP